MVAGQCFRLVVCAAACRWRCWLLCQCTAWKVQCLGLMAAGSMVVHVKHKYWSCCGTAAA
jgi:hypothetical protein